MLSEFANPLEVTSIHPGSSFGSFQLGWDVIACVKELRREERRLGRWLVAGDVGSQQPVGAPISIYLPKLQTHLHFHPMAQRLERVVVANVDQFGGGEVRYRGRVLCGPRHSPTFSRVIDVFGPTVEGSIDAQTGRYSLRYPGLTVDFLIPRGYIDCYTGDHSAHPMTLPDGTTPLATALTVEPASAAQFAARLRLPISGLVLCADTIAVDPKRGIRFTRSGVAINFGMAPQEVICLLGGPETLYPKQDDRLLIHNPALNKRHAGANTSPSYFLTFPLLGIDVMFDGVTHRAVKIICFNSVPPHETFLRYLRAHFVVDHNGLKVDGNTNFVEEIKPLLPRAPQPLLHSHNGVPMRIYCFRGIIYYVLGNGLIASIMVFEAPSLPAAVAQSSARPPLEAGIAAPSRKEDSFTASLTPSPTPPPLLADEPTAAEERQRTPPAAIDDAPTQPIDPFQFFTQPMPFPDPTLDRQSHGGQSTAISTRPRPPAVGFQDSREGVSPVSADDERSGAESLVRRGDSDFGTPVLRNIRHGFDAMVRPSFSPDTRSEGTRGVGGVEGDRQRFFAELQLPSDLWDSTPTQSEETAVFTSPSRSRAEPHAPPATLRVSPRATTSESGGADESESRSGASGWESVAQSSDDPTAQAPAAEPHGRRHKKSKKART